MTQIQQLGFLANNLTVNTSANTATFNNILVVGNSSVNVVVNSSSVYVSGVALGSGGGTNVAAQYAWTNTQSFSAVVTHTANVSVNGAIIANGGAGGSGVVIIAVPYANYTGTTTGSPTVTTVTSFSGTYKILTFTASGSYTA